MQASDTHIYKTCRQILVDDLRRKGITDKQVLVAIRQVPRHAFMDDRFVRFAYQDDAFPIAAGQTISQPYTVAFQTQILDIQKGDKVLEIGTGSGYQCAVLLELTSSVFSIERQKILYESASKRLKELGYAPHLRYGDGHEGWPEEAPFDKILITAAAHEIPPLLLKQLKIGGRLVMPVGGAYTQKMTLAEKISDTEFTFTEHGGFVFVPLLKGKI
jgi:protein-L-isoaspartate(D-aspartate) O-methyltransferase